MANPTVADLVAALLKLPQDAEVECKKDVSCGYDNYTEFRAVDIEYGITLFDYTDPKYAGRAVFGRKFVQIEAE